MTRALPPRARGLAAAALAGLVLGPVVGQLAGPAAAQATATAATSAVTSVVTTAAPAAPAVVEKPTDVFVGTVAVRKPVAGERKVFDYTVNVESVYRGDINTRRVKVRTTSTFVPCPRSPLTEQTVSYAFRAERAGTGLVVRGCRYVEVAGPTVLDRFTRTFGAPHDPVSSPDPTDPASVQTTRVDVAEPRTFTRTAAPGFAAVLVALLGWVALRRLARR